MYASTIATSPSSRLLEDVKNLHQTRADNHHKEKGDQHFGNRKLILVLGCLADRNISSLVNVLVELFVSVTDTTWERLQGKK
jgi:hypothetical protein